MCFASGATAALAAVAAAAVEWARFARLVRLVLLFMDVWVSLPDVSNYLSCQDYAGAGCVEYLVTVRGVLVTVCGVSVAVRGVLVTVFSTVWIGFPFV